MMINKDNKNITKIGLIIILIIFEIIFVGTLVLFNQFQITEEHAIINCIISVVGIIKASNDFRMLDNEDL